jgi:hypothetical protein
MLCQISHLNDRLSSGMDLNMAKGPLRSRITHLTSLKREKNVFVAREIKYFLLLGGRENALLERAFIKRSTVR